MTKITVTEALRLKNEIANAIKTLQYAINNASFGEMTEDGEIVSQDREKFNDIEETLLKGLAISEEINNTLSAFNKVTAIDSIVRKLQNEKLMLSVYTNNLGKTKPSKTNRFENLNSIRKSISIEYKPYNSSTEFKDKISSCKDKIRLYQSQIERLNQEDIEVSFNFNDVENLTI